MNREQEIKTEDLRTVGIRYFSEKDNGIEVSKNLGFAFLYRLGEDNYVNLFNPVSNYPLFVRVPYSNVTSDGEEYGSKVALVCGEEKTGPCYVTIYEKATDLFKKDVVTIGEVEDYMLSSQYYFVDRSDIAKTRLPKNSAQMRKIMAADGKSYAEMEEFFEQRNVELQKVYGKK